jgi:chromosome segregation ATPase
MSENTINCERILAELAEMRTDFNNKISEMQTDFNNKISNMEIRIAELANRTDDHSAKFDDHSARIQEVSNKADDSITRLQEVSGKVDSNSEKLISLSELATEMSGTMVEAITKKEFLGKFDTSALLAFTDANAGAISNKVQAKEPPRKYEEKTQMTFADYFILCFTSKKSVPCHGTNKMLLHLVRDKIYSGKTDPFAESMLNDNNALAEYAKQTYELYSQLGDKAPFHKQIQTLYSRHLQAIQSTA